MINIEPLEYTSQNKEVNLLKLVEKGKFPFLIENYDGTEILLVTGISWANKHQCYALPLKSFDNSTVNQMRQIFIAPTSSWKIYNGKISVTLNNVGIE